MWSVTTVNTQNTVKIQTKIPLKYRQNTATILKCHAFSYEKTGFLVHRWMEKVYFFPSIYRICSVCGELGRSLEANQKERFCYHV